MTDPQPGPVAEAERALESDLKFLVTTEPGRARLRVLIKAYAAKKALAVVDDYESADGCDHPEALSLRGLSVCACWGGQRMCRIALREALEEEAAGA